MDREQLVYYGVGLEVVLMLIGAAVCWIWPIALEMDPLRTTLYLTNLGAIFVGVASAIGMFGIGLLLWYSRAPKLREMRDFLMEQLAPAMSQCRAWEVILIAVSAGVGEEILFRGVLQPRIGWVAATVLFALVHAVSPTYVLVTFGLGTILAWIQLLSGNLWAAIIAHAAYDYWMFLVLIRAHRGRNNDSVIARSPPTNRSPENNDVDSEA